MELDAVCKTEMLFHLIDAGRPRRPRVTSMHGMCVGKKLRVVASLFGPVKLLSGKSFRKFSF